MILLSVSDSLRVVNSTTDWMQGLGAIIQAIGAVFAIGVIIWGFSQLNKDSKDKQKQIDSLTDLAKESKTANELFKSKMDEEKRIRKLSIQPRIEIVNLKQHICSYIDFELINRWGEAKNIKLTDLEDCTAHSSFYFSPFRDLQFLGTNEIVHLIFNPIGDQNVIDGCLLHTKISYVDIENNSYCQIIEGKVSMFDCLEPYKLSEPSELK